MTEKRFKHKWNMLGMQFICYDCKDVLLGTFADKEGVEHIVDLLNELDSENIELKKVLQYETQMHNKWKTECITETQENNRIKNTINEMYETERTQLGQSVLKQLLEAIQ